MTINMQMKILNTKNYYQYLKENSSYIKELNRHDRNYNKFIDFVKDKYQLRINDRISKTLDNIDMISNVLKVLK